MDRARVARSIQIREQDWFSSRPSRPFFATFAVKRFCLLVWIRLALRAQSRPEKKTGFLRVLRGHSSRPLRLNAFFFWYGYGSRCALNPDLSSAHIHHKPAQATADISQIANP